MFNLAGTAAPCNTPAPDTLASLATRQVEATLAWAREENNEYFRRERDKLEAWAEDQMCSAEQQLQDTKDRIRDAKRRSRTADNLEDQKAAQESLRELEKQQRRQRTQIFEVEDEIEARRDQLIEALEPHMHQHSSTHHIFRIRWRLS